MCFGEAETDALTQCLRRAQGDPGILDVPRVTYAVTRVLECRSGEGHVVGVLGPQSAGQLPDRAGSLDEEVIKMRHTDDEIEQAGSRFEQLADELDPATAEVDHAEDLRAIAAVSEAIRADEARLREAVEVARAHDRSRNQIAVALGVSRQAARQRFTDKTHA
jgi:hypothetical protein